MPSFVAAGAHTFTGLGIEQLDHLLQAQHIHDPLKLQPGSPPRWTMPRNWPGCWVDNEFPFTPTWRPNTAAPIPASSRLTSHWSL